MMTRQKIFLSSLFLSFCFLISTQCHALTLKEYRTRYSKNQIDTDLSREVEKRIETIRDLLGHPTPEIKLTDEKGAPLEYPKVFGRSRMNFSSTFFKHQMQLATENLRLQEMFGVEVPYDPAKVFGEMKADQHERNRFIFEQSFPKFELFLDQVWLQVKDGDYQEPPADSESAKYERVLTAAIQNYLKASEPLEKDPKTGAVLPNSQSILGTLIRAEVFEYYVTRLVFQKPKEPPIYVSLSMLVSFETRRDLAYVSALQLLAEKLETELKVYYEKTEDGSPKLDGSGNPILRKLNDVEKIRHMKLIESLPYVRQKLEGASYAGAKLAQLTQVLRRFLIDLLLRFRKTDVPADEEIIPLNQIAFEKTPRVPDPIPENYVRPAPPTELLDFQFYGQLNKDLLQLEDFLRLDKKMAEQKEILMTEARQKQK